MKSNFFIAVIVFMLTEAMIIPSYVKYAHKAADVEQQLLEEAEQEAVIEEEPEEGMAYPLSYYSYGEYTKVPIANAYASSQLEDADDYYRYSALNLFDGDESTAYVEGAEGDGIGQMIDIRFGTDTDSALYPITKIEILPGYQKSDETYANNSVPTKLEFHFYNGKVVTWQMQNVNETVKSAEITLDEPILASGCTVVIKDAVTGKKYSDCCISELAFYTQDTEGMLFYGQDVSYGDINTTFEIDAYYNQEMFWSYQAFNPLTELSALVPLFEMQNDKIYVYDDGKISALDAVSGETMWTNDDFGGYPSAWDFDDAGNLYVCGYYGPDLMVIDKYGNTVVREDDISDGTCCWPSMLTVNDSDGGKVSIYFDHCDGEDNGTILTVE